VDRQLETILVFIDQSLDLEKIVLLKGVEHFFNVVLHLSVQLTAAIAQG
jgi:hypothetical protein